MTATTVSSPRQRPASANLYNSGPYRPTARRGRRRSVNVCFCIAAANVTDERRGHSANEIFWRQRVLPMFVLRDKARVLGFSLRAHPDLAVRMQATATGGRHCGLPGSVE
jgi:hypothetical protein